MRSMSKSLSLSLSARSLLGTFFFFTVAPAAYAADVTIYNNGAFATGWQNWSWACSSGCSAPSNQAGGPLANDLGHWGGLFLATSNIASIAPTANLTFKMTPLSTTNNFLNVTLTRQDRYGAIFTSYAVPTVGLPLDAEGYVNVTVPMATLNPSGLNFDGMQFQATSDWPAGSFIRVNNVAVTGASTVIPQAPERAGASTNPTTATATASISCAATSPISPRIYGIAFGAEGNARWSMEATSHRWGGNSTTRFNPNINAWNLANDWYFQNYTSSQTWQQFLVDNVTHSTGGAVSIPTIGWVAKDTTSNGFPVSVYGPQGGNDWQWRPDAGNGRSPAGALLTVTQAPTQTSTPFTPDNAAAWVRQLKAASGGRVDHYILDNEPDLWSDTHRDVRTTRLRSADLVQNTKDFATAIRGADPTGQIAGPAVSGIFAMRYSDYDNNNGLYSGGPGSDRSLMGGSDMAPWYLQQLKAHETATGVKMLDLLDVHYYPQGNNVYGGGLDLATARLRVRSTRSLWDASYVDESWYGQYGNPPVNLLPTLQGWIAGNYPGLGISIGEYSFGAEGHMSGAVAQAEALGRFGQAINVGGQRYPGVESAYYWTYPSENTPHYWAFKGFRNFDNKGNGFGDTSLDTSVSPAINSGNGIVSVFGSKHSATNEMVAAVINLSDDKNATTTVSLTDCPAATSVTAYTYDGSTNGYVAKEAQAVTGQSVAVSSVPWSITFLRFASTAVASQPLSDFNTDGKSDFLLKNSATGDIVLWYMNGATYQSGVSLGALPGPYIFAGTGDFNGDGKTDILIRNTSTGDIIVWFMNGTTYLGGAFISNLDPIWTIAGTPDLNGDGKADILFKNNATGDVVTWLMNGTNYLAGAYIGNAPPAWTINGTGDFNGDGKADIMLKNSSTGDIVVWNMNGVSYQTGTYIGNVSLQWSVIGNPDLNGDGKADILLHNTRSGEIVVWYMNGAAYTGGALVGVLPPVWRMTPI